MKADTISSRFEAESNFDDTIGRDNSNFRSTVRKYYYRLESALLNLKGAMEPLTGWGFIAGSCCVNAKTFPYEALKKMSDGNLKRENEERYFEALVAVSQCWGYIRDAMRKGRFGELLEIVDLNREYPENMVKILGGLASGLACGLKEFNLERIAESRKAIGCLNSLFRLLDEVGRNHQTGDLTNEDEIEWFRGKTEEIKKLMQDLIQILHSGSDNGLKFNGRTQVKLNQWRTLMKRIHGQQDRSKLAEPEALAL